MIRIIFIIASLLMVESSFASLNWQKFKSKYLKDGYIIDPYNNNRITSEAQGYGLLISVLENDKETFDKILNWTNKNLKRKDNLFSWYWKGKIIDKNNAIDADFFIAYSLLLAYDKWKEYKYFQEFKEIYKSIRKHILPVCSLTKTDYIILPARYGFVKDEFINIFPSYYIPFIFKTFSLVEQQWENIYKYTYQLLKDYQLTDTLKYNIFEKKFIPNKYITMDVYRTILYVYLDDKNNLSILRKSFGKVHKFFKQNGYIPLEFNINSSSQTKEQSPYCVYLWFYMLYNDKGYEKKYIKLKNQDRKNYFCDALQLIYEKMGAGK